MLSIWRIAISVFLCASLGAAYIGVVYAALSTSRTLVGGYPPRGGPGWPPLQVLMGMSLLSAACSGAVTGAVYAVTGGRLGVALSGIIGGLASPTLAATFQLTPASFFTSLPPSRVALFLTTGLGIPIVTCLVFAWLLYRAGEAESALPLLTPVALIQKGTGVQTLPALTRLATGSVLGIPVACTIASVGARYLLRMLR